MKKIYSLVALAMAFGAQTASAELAFNDVFPVTFAKGMPAGWALSHDVTPEFVDGNLKVTCPQEAPNFRTDLKYNMLGETGENYYFSMDASKYSVFSISFIGSRPSSGALKLSNISVAGEGWIKGKEGYSLNETGWTDIEDLDGNHTYYWTVGGEKWTGNVTVEKIEIVIADIKDAADKTYVIKNLNWFASVADLENSLNLKQETAVKNETTGRTYADLNAAWGAVANGETLVINENQVVSSRLDCGERSITLKGGKEGVTITRDNASNMMFLANKGGDFNLTLENLVLDGKSADSDKNFIEASGSSAVTLNNVKVQNVKGTNAIGLIVAKNGGKLVINNLIVDNCAVNENTGEVFFGTSSSVISGKNDFTLSVEKTNTFSVEGTLDNIKPITIYCFGDNFINGNTLVKNFTDASQFELAAVTANNLKLVAQDGNLVLSDGTTGVAEFENAANEAVEYYNLQGVRVNNPENGIFIRKQGAKVSKVVIK